MDPTRPNRKRRTEVIVRKNKGFTLIELLVVIAIIALLIGILLPAIGKARDTAKNVLSQTNIRQFSQGMQNYAADNSDLIASYSWKGPRGDETIVFLKMSYGNDRPANSDQQAAAWQQTDILYRATGRYQGDFKFVNFNGRLPHRRYNHIPLIDYLTTTQPEPTAASPFDKNLIEWQQNPTDVTAANNIPYAPGTTPENDGYLPAASDNSESWGTLGIRQRWAFASTYQTVPAAWNQDAMPSYQPIDDNPHLMMGGNTVPLGGRKITQVAFPAGKVFQFEEFDRFSSRQGLYYIYPEAQSNMSFFDGSVRRERTGDANPGWNPSTPDQEFRQRYQALHTFPLPKTGPDEATTYCPRYRWTRGGLKGIDYGGADIGRRQFGLEDDPDCEQ
jgi:prepilin-type N-terminal cleavage/methylation domain-containing protein